MARVLHGLSISRPDLVEVFERWRTIIYPSLRKGTKSEYQKPILLYLEWLEENELEILPYDPNPAEQMAKIYRQLNDFFADKDFLLSRMGKVRGTDISEQYLNVMFYAISNLYSKLFFRELDKKFLTVQGRKSDHKPRLLTQEQVDLLLNSEHDFVRRTMIRVGYHCALRSSELVTLKTTDYENGVLKVRVAKSKREKIKEVPLPNDLREDLETLIEQVRSRSGYIFKREVKVPFKGFTKRRWIAGEWSTWFGNYSERVLGERIRWHDFARHTRLTLYAEQPDTDFKDVLLLSGHSNPAVCLMYFERAKAKIADLEKMLPKPLWD